MHQGGKTCTASLAAALAAKAPAEPPEGSSEQVSLHGTSVESLRISHNDFGGVRGSTAWAEWLRGAAALKVFERYMRRMRRMHRMRRMRRMRHNARCVRHVRHMHHVHHVRHVRHVHHVHYLRHMRHIHPPHPYQQEFSLRNCNASVRILLPAILAGAPQLARLDLSGNKLSRTDAAALLQLVCQVPT